MRKFLGYSLYEVIVVLGVVSLVLIGIVSLATRSIRNSSFSQNNAMASKYAQEAIEWLRQERDKSWDNFYSKASSSGNIYCLRNLNSWPSPSPNGCGINDFIEGTNNFYRESTLSLVSIDGPSSTIVNALVVVRWNDSQGTHSVRSATTFTYWNR